MNIEPYEEPLAPPPSRASFIFKALGLSVVAIIALGVLVYLADKVVL